MASVYVDSSVPSYLVANPSRDLIVAARQQLTHDWWNDLGPQFELFVSPFVLREIEDGDPAYSGLRLNSIVGLDVLPNVVEVDDLSMEYAARLGLTGRAVVDVPHFAFAVHYEMDYLLTWNMKHLANVRVLRRLRTLNEEFGLQTPIVCTPEYMLEVFEEDMT